MLIIVIAWSRYPIMQSTYNKTMRQMLIPYYADTLYHFDSNDFMASSIVFHHQINDIVMKYKDWQC